MKAAGVLPEHIVISLKRIALDAEIQWTNHALFERLIDWCLAHYYAEFSGRTTLCSSD
jgi:hypothetical protein